MGGCAGRWQKVKEKPVLMFLARYHKPSELDKIIWSTTERINTMRYPLSWCCWKISHRYSTWWRSVGGRAISYIYCVIATEEGERQLEWHGQTWNDKYNYKSHCWYWPLEGIHISNSITWSKLTVVQLWNKQMPQNVKHYRMSVAEAWTRSFNTMMEFMRGIWCRGADGTVVPSASSWHYDNNSVSKS